MIRGLVRLILTLATLAAAYTFYSHISGNGILDMTKKAFTDSYEAEKAREDSPLNTLEEKGVREGLKDLAANGDKTSKKNPGKAPRTTLNPKQAQQALTTVKSLSVKGRAPKTGYDRDQFGAEWSDSAGEFAWTGNGLDTRNDVLSRDLTKVECKTGTKSDTGSCKVLSGILKLEPYTGAKNVKFIAGGAYENALDTEHIVALGDAWQKGAQQWSAEKRAAFANDPINLMMVDPSSNRQKGDADFATWLPPNKAYRCTYAAKQIKVKKKYALWVTKAEKKAFIRVLTPCSK